MKIFTTIKSKFLSLAIFLTVFPAIIIIYCVNRNAENIFTEHIHDILTTVHYSYKNTIDELISKGLNYGEFIANDGSLKEAVVYQMMTDDNSVLLNVLEGHYKKLDLNNIEFTDKKGIVKARGHLPEKYNDSKKEFPFTRKMINEPAKGWDYETGKGGITLKFGVPISAEDEFVGFVGYGYYIDNNFLNLMKKVLDSELVFIRKTDKKIIASTNDKIKIRRINQTFLDNSLKGKKETELQREIDGKVFSLLYLPIFDSSENIFASLCVLKDVSRNMDEHNDNLKFILILISCVMITALIFGLLVIRSVNHHICLIVDGVKNSSGEVASVSEQVSRYGQSLSESSSEQASVAEEASSALEEVTSETRQNSDNARHVNGLMQEVKRIIERAGKSMTELTDSMNVISESSEDMSKIIKTIDEIAFQTNLLALNASIEAARAGDLGTGFSVVAEEVRNLAMRAAEAAKRTASLIAGTGNRVKAVEGFVNKTNEAFKELYSNASNVAELIGKIARASDDQDQKIKHINVAVADIDKTIQQNAANAQESASAAEELNAQAEQLKNYVESLAALVGVLKKR